MARFTFLLFSLISALATAQVPDGDWPPESNLALYNNLIYLTSIRHYINVMMHIPLDKQYWLGTFDWDVKLLAEPLLTYIV